MNEIGSGYRFFHDSKFHQNFTSKMFYYASFAIEHSKDDDLKYFSDLPKYFFNFKETFT